MEKSESARKSSPSRYLVGGAFAGFLSLLSVWSAARCVLTAGSTPVDKCLRTSFCRFSPRRGSGSFVRFCTDYSAIAEALLGKKAFGLVKK